MSLSFDTRVAGTSFKLDDRPKSRNFAQWEFYSGVDFGTENDLTSAIQRKPLAFSKILDLYPLWIT